MSAISQQTVPTGEGQNTSLPATSWLLKLILPGHHGRLLTSILIFCLLLPVFYLGSGESQQDSIPALFFSLVIAYIIPVFSYITEKAQEAMRQLRPLLSLDDAECNHRLQQLSTVRPTLTLLHLGIGATLGSIHMSLVAGSPWAVITRISSSPAEFLSIAALKDKTLSDLNKQIVAHLDRGGQDTQAAHIDPALASLLVYRREIMMVSTWPFDLGNIAKLSFYMIIPPLTWVAAALIENLVDAIL